MARNNNNVQSKINLAVLGNKIDNFTVVLKDHINEDALWKKELPEKLEKKFAAKWSEWIVKSMVGLILAASILSVLGRVLR